MNVTIVGPFWFPHGAASAARIRNFAFGLRDCGARVHVISMAPPPATGDPRPPGNALAPGVSCEYVAPTVAAVDGWRDPDRTVPRLRERFFDKVRWFAGLYGATPAARRRLRARIEGNECDLVLAYDRSAIRMTPLARLCRARGITSVLDVVEASDYLGARRSSPLYWDAAAGTRHTPRLFDGVSVISAGLEELYRAQGIGRTLVIPALEEWPAAPPPAPSGHPVFHFTYVGKFAPRDEPELLVEAVRLLARRRLPLVLDVVGYYEATESGRRFLRQCAEDADLQRVVRFHGTLSDGALRARLARSDALVLTRRKARPEELSFPTRLVEYLRFGRPVLVSDVGDVRRYLRDGVDAVLLDPGDPRRVAEAMAGLALRPDRGAPMGHRGRDAGARAFDRKAHAGRLLAFAAELGGRAAS